MRERDHGSVFSRSTEAAPNTGSAVKWDQTNNPAPAAREGAKEEQGQPGQRHTSDRVPLGVGTAEYDEQANGFTWHGPTRTELTPGTVINHYEIIRQIGSGGMGVVYLARDRKLGRKVAVKVLNARGPEFTRRFITEAQATAQCTHENIVVIHEVGEFQGDPYMVLEYLEGQSLADLRDAPRGEGRAVEVVTGIARALVRAHDAGIVHRDLKPENVFLTNSGSVKVLDFGIAKLLKSSEGRPQNEGSLRDVSCSPTGHSKRSTVSGTVAYMSPEQWGAADFIDHRTDIWSLGLILAELVMGSHPLDDLEDPVTWVRDLSHEFSSFTQRAPLLSAELSSVIEKCLRKDKAERYGDASDLLRALEPFLPGHLATGPVTLDFGPYAGLRAFQEEDASRFFGREKEVATLAARLIDTPLVAVVGPSGIGKSSLLRAGVVPALKASGSVWRVLVTRPGRDPIASLARLIASLTSKPAGDDEQRLMADLREKLILEPGYFGNVLRSEATATRTRLLVLVDQFEELYTLDAQGLGRKAFLACLLGAADDAESPLRVVTTLRADFLGRVAEDPGFMDEVSNGLVFLGPPTPEGLTQALLRPAELAGYRFESDAMVREMVAYLESTPAGLPLLQFAAAQLWEARDPSRKLLTEGAYRGLGGVAGALVSHADRVLSGLSPSLKALCRSLFVQLVTLERTRAVRRIDELRELLSASAGSGEVERLIRHLVDSRLLVTQSADGTASAELVHESLITNWPALRRWLEESLEDSLFLDQLIAAARQWNHNRRDRGLLWSGDMVAELERFERRYKGKLPQMGREFADAAYALARSGVRKRRVIAISGVLLLLGLLAATNIALLVIRKSQVEAQDSATEARAAHTRATQELEVRKRAEEKERGLSEELRRALATLQVANEQLKGREEALRDRERALKGALAQLQEALLVAETAKSDAIEQKENAEHLRKEAQVAKDEALVAVREQEERIQYLLARVGKIIKELK